MTSYALKWIHSRSTCFVFFHGSMVLGCDQEPQTPAHICKRKMAPDGFIWPSMIRDKSVLWDLFPACQILGLPHLLLLFASCGSFQCMEYLVAMLVVVASGLLASYKSCSTFLVHPGHICMHHFDNDFLVHALNWIHFKSTVGPVGKYLLCLLSWQHGARLWSRATNTSTYLQTENGSVR
jgi:hypothetical protein